MTATALRNGPGGRLRAGALLGVLVAGLVGCGQPVDGEAPAGTQAVRGRRPLPDASELLASERNTIDIFRRVSPSVVYVADATIPRGGLRYGAMPQGAGSGFVWDERGHIVTNYHVVHNGERFTVTTADGIAHDAELVGVAPRKDLAVLRIEPQAPLRPVELGDSHRLLVGQKVLAIGNPFGLDSSLTVGVISALGREIESLAGTRIEDVIQTDASINPGNSGGPLLDSHGRVIGVTTAIYSTSGASAGVGFAVPAGTVERLVPQLIEHGRVKWAVLGANVLPDHIAAQWGVIGVIVRDVLPGSPAERAGLRGLQLDRTGNVRSLDVITHVEGRPVVRLVDLIDVLDDFEPGDVVTVRFERDGETKEVEVTLAEMA